MTGLRGSGRNGCADVQGCRGNFLLHGWKASGRIGKTLFLHTLFISLLLTLPGCWTDKGGKHCLIVGIGFGIITTTNQPGVEVRNSQIIGGAIGPDVTGLGWLQSHRVIIDPALASNVVISVKSSPMKTSIQNFNVSNNPVLQPNK